MRIPLDYYRILGLPIQATVEQLQQAHRDRALQLPRREYSEAAIASRKQLLDEAYGVLSDPEQRRQYDSNFLGKSQEYGEPEDAGMGAIAPSSYASSIDVQEPQFVGALLILLDLGEYELVLKLGRPSLNSARGIPAGQPASFDIVRSDILLTLALAHLELGREQWQQGQYESAASSLEAGQDLLLREGVFASVRGEMQADLFKLRPYRILELLSLSTASERERRQGLGLLQDMLHERGGIDGTGNDQSGLNVDDFLRFVQQLRGYLTAAEQQSLFEAEARRPSAVATYLAVYALLARGFAYRQPALIRRAKHLLLRLSTRQDVHLEQSVCALLLGQTEEANRALELSREHEPIEFIREHSKGSPDLLPGLCLYSERWLQGEVFPHFRDLANQQAYLKDYFADPQVQSYLEELPNDPEITNLREMDSTGFGRTSNRQDMAEQGASYEALGGTRILGTATMEPSALAGSDGVPTAERVAQLSPEGRLGDGRNGGRMGDRPPLARRTASPSKVPASRSSQGGRSPRLDRILFLIALSVLGISVAWLLLNWVARSMFGGPSLQGDQLEISLSDPFIDIPAPEPEPTVNPNAPMTAAVARGAIQGWLDAKTAASSPQQDLSQLSEVLTGSILAERQEAAQTGGIRQYRHQLLDVQIAPPNPQTPDQAQAEAIVVEVVDNETPERLSVRYDFVRQNGRWLIQGIEALSSEPAAAAPEVDTSSELPSSAPLPGAAPSSTDPTGAGTTGESTPAPSPSPQGLDSPGSAVDPTAPDL